MSQETDLIAGPEADDFNSGQVRIEYDTDAGADWMAEVWGTGVNQVTIRKSSYGAFLSHVAAKGMTIRTARDESEMTFGNAPT